MNVMNVLGTLTSLNMFNRSQHAHFPPIYSGSAMLDFIVSAWIMAFQCSADLCLSEQMTCDFLLGRLERTAICDENNKCKDTRTEFLLHQNLKCRLSHSGARYWKENGRRQRNRHQWLKKQI